MVSVPAMTRSSMDAIKLSSWKRLSFLFFSLKSTRGKKSHKIISLDIQQAQEVLHNLQHSWLLSCVCELGDKMDLNDLECSASTRCGICRWKVWRRVLVQHPSPLNAG